MEKIKNYPSHIARPFTAFTQADDESAMHKSLLDMGESFLTYLVGIMFGEYIPKEDIAEEKEESESFSSEAKEECNECIGFDCDCDYSFHRVLLLCEKIYVWSITLFSKY